MRWFILLAFILVGCAASPSTTEIPAPNRTLSAPTLAPSPTFSIQNSDELYEQVTPDGLSNPTVQALPVDSGLPPLAIGTPSNDGAIPIQIVLDDSTALAGSLYEQANGRASGILLVSTDALGWGDLPQQLLLNGHTVLVVEASNLAIIDMETLLIALIEMGSVDPARVAVIASRRIADTALLTCAVNQICDYLVLLSPQDTGLSTQVEGYNPRPILVASAQTDAQSYPASIALVNNTTNGQLLAYAEGSGTTLLFNTDLIPQIIGFLAPLLTPLN